MDGDASAAWNAITGGGFVALLVALGSGIKYLFDLRKGAKQTLETYREGLIEDLKERADEAEAEVRRVREESEVTRLKLLAEMATTRAQHAAELAEVRATAAAADKAARAAEQRERRYSIYHLALADFWHARSRLLWHMCSNWEQYAYSVVFLLRGLATKHPQDVPPGLMELLDKPPERALEPPPFQTPTPALADQRPKDIAA